MEKHNLPSFTSFLLSFEAPSNNVDETFNHILLENIIGGGNAFHIGGPGDGLSSLVFSQYLGRFPLFNLQSEYHSYSETGMFSIHGHASHEDAQQFLPRVVIGLCYDVFPFLTEKNIESAKRRTKSSMFRNMEKDNVLSQYILSDYQEYGEFRTTTKYIHEKIDSVTKDDLIESWKKCLKGNISLVCIGNEKELHRKEGVERILSTLNKNLENI